jgi:penicillin amidase
MKSKVTKLAVIFLSVIVLLLLLSFGAIRIMIKRPLPGYTGTLTLEGLTAAVEVRTDDYGVPHIFAQNEDDLFFAQGFITARERFFQMDTMRLAGRGELSTYFGEDTVGADKFFKTVGFYRKAELEYRLLDPDSKTIVEAYTKGVNAYLDTLKSLPIEYTILGVKPRPWEPQDSLVAGLLMAYSLNRSKDTELVLHQIGEQAGGDILNYIIPVLPPYAPTVSERVSGSAPDAMGAFYAVVAGGAPGGSGSGSGTGSGSGWSSPVSLDIPGSNWMIFSGAKTTTGGAVFAGSPDLEPQIPALFFLIRLQGGKYDVIGGSIAGVPGINVLGFNRHIAWSTVNGRGDEMDFFIEELNPADPGQYLTENGYEKFELLEEVVRVKTKDGFREEGLVIKVSRHGPVISDVMPGAPANCAMQWVGLMPPTNMFQGLRELMTASNFEEFRRALSVIKTPTLNFGYADVYGNIGYQFVMSVPLRGKGDGTVPVPGSTGEYEWTGFVPFEDLPYDYNPGKGYLASFNNLPGDTGYHITSFFMFERALRFKDIIDGKDLFTPEEIRGLQLDRVSVVAKRWVPEILGACSDLRDLNGVRNPDKLATVLGLLEKWDYSIGIDSPEATIFNSFYKHFIINTLEDNLGAELTAALLKPYLVYQPDMLLANINDSSDHLLFDDLRTPEVKESKDDIIRKSMGDAVAELSAKLDGDPAKWRWGRVHTMTFRHPFGEKLPFFNLKPIPMPGDSFTINAGILEANDNYEMVAGGVIRMVVHMADMGSATFISPPGQSGHYGSPHYSDQAEIWAGGRQIPANFLNAHELPRLLILKPGR